MSSLLRLGYKLTISSAVRSLSIIDARESSSRVSQGGNSSLTRPAFGFTIRSPIVRRFRLPDLMDAAVRILSASLSRDVDAQANVSSKGRRVGLSSSGPRLS